MQHAARLTHPASGAHGARIAARTGMPQQIAPRGLQAQPASRTDQVPPSRRQRHHFVSLKPGQPTRTLGLGVGPPSDPVRGHQVGDNTPLLQFTCNLCPELRVPLRPRRQVIASRKPVALLVVALTVAEHEVVAAVSRRVSAKSVRVTLSEHSPEFSTTPRSNPRGPTARPSTTLVLGGY